MYEQTCQFFVTFLVWSSDPLKRLSDLQVRDQKVTKLNHLENKNFKKKSANGC